MVARSVYDMLPFIYEEGNLNINLLIFKKKLRKKLFVREWVRKQGGGDRIRKKLNVFEYFVSVLN